MQYAIKGGIGDFLQCLPFMLKHPRDEYYVVSHQKDAAGFFRWFGIEVQEVSFGQLPECADCPRQLFFESNPFAEFKSIYPRPWIGIHLGASNYSLSVEARFGFSPKALPRSLLEGLAKSDFDLLVFGSPKELLEIGNGPWTLVIEDNVHLSLARVAECKAFIGSDSAFKTMSAMLRIPTLVLMGDYTDRHRDEKFIEPYMREGVMSVFRYRDLTREIDDAVAFCRSMIDNPAMTGWTRYAALA